MLYSLRIMAVVFACLAMVPAGAHLFSVASKLRLDGDAYLAAQRAYDGWNLFAIVVIGAVISSLVLTIALYRSGEGYFLAAIAFLCLAGTQVIFLDLHVPDEQGDGELDDTSAEVGVPANAVGILTRRQCGPELHRSGSAGLHRR